MSKDYRNQLYSHYVRSHLPGSIKERVEVRAPYLRRLINIHFPERLDAKILEIGCGHGALIYYAKKMGYNRLEGIDASLEQVEEAWKLGLRDNVRQEDLMETLSKSADKTYDIIVALDVIEHMTKSELLDLVEELHRVLCSGGKLILHMPNAASPFFGRVRYGDYTHEQAFTQSSLSQLLVAHGFSEVQCFEDTPIVHGAKSVVRWIVWKVVRSVFRLALIAETGAKNEIFTQNFLAVAVKD
ncbi:MAG TPA: class I SAM-dependent methyltransferase [Gammaproteobacteria bacterium]|nr:class I SAM-dependent methyltransferase [Gammaproteobacteria bacterium]